MPKGGYDLDYMVFQLCEMGAGDKLTIEKTISVDDALEWFMFRQYNAYIDEKVIKHAR